MGEETLNDANADNEVAEAVTVRLAVNVPVPLWEVVRTELEAEPVSVEGVTVTESRLNP